jgi:hypothetical protein
MSCVFDGNYIWISAKQAGKSHVVIAFDPETKQNWTIGEAEGLPQGVVPGIEMHVAPLGVGKVCIVGNTGRAWVATAELAEDGKRSCRVVFEARETIEGNDLKQAGNVHIQFEPGFAVTLWNADRSQCRVIVGRRSHADCIMDYPLLLDPQNGTAEVATFKMRGDFEHRFFAYNDKQLFLLHGNYPKPWEMLKVEFPGTQPKVLIEHSPEGSLALDDRGLHIIGREWWRADTQTGELKSIVQKVPWFYSDNYAPGRGENKLYGVDLKKTTMIFRVVPTSFYGPLVGVRDGQGNGRNITYWRLNLDAPAP